MRKRRGAGRRRTAVRGGGESEGRRLGRRRPRAADPRDSDDGDEEYIAEEEESSGESSPATPGGSDEEEEFQFGDSSDEEEAAATAEVELEEEEEEEEFDDDLLEASRSNIRGRNNCANGRMRKFRVSDEEELGESRSKPPQRVSYNSRNGNVRKFRVSDDEDEFEVELENLRWKSRSAPSRKRNGVVNKFRVSDVDEEGESQGISRQKSQGASCNNHNVTVNNLGVSDNEEEESEDVLASRRNEAKSSASLRRRNFVDSDYEVDEEEELEDVLVPKRKNAKSSVRPRRWNSIDSDYEVDEEEELEDGLAPKRNGVKSSARPPSRNSVDSDYEVDEEEEDDEEDYVDDEDFSPDAEDMDDGEGSSNLKITSSMCQKQKSRGKQKGSKGRPKRSEYDDDFLVEEDDEGKRMPRRSNYDDDFIAVEDERRKRRPRRSEYDDDFILEDVETKRRPRKETKRRPRKSEYDDDFIVDKDKDSKHRKRKRIGKGIKKKRSKRARMAKKLPESEDSDPDFVNSDYDFEEKDKVTLNHRRKRIKNGKKGNRGGSRKLKISSDSSETSSSLSDSDFEICEEELRDLGIVQGVLSGQQPKGVFAERKEEDKGKEKLNDESGKLVCGICLSEEQKRTVRGVLNCCAHYFCFACIVAWSKVESRCPVCKRRFEMITKSSRSDSALEPKKSVIMVQKRDQVYQPSEEEIRRMLDPYENVVCMECQQGGDDNLMLLCDICDSSAHTYCVGLGREVPEGNWYCECCRSATDGLLYPQTQYTFSDLQASNLEFSVRSIETEGAGDACVDAELQRPISLPGQHTTLAFDLNASPRLDEDYVTTSQASGGGASTLSGRREIHRRIRLILSTSRRNQNSAGSVIPQNSQSGVITSETEGPAGSLHGSDGMILLNPVLSGGPCPQNTTPSQSNDNILPCTHNAESSFRHVEGAKEQVKSMVKRHLKDMSRELQLEHATFKDIVSRSTHTILAACGIEHKRRMVSSSVHPPSNCSHYLERQPVPLVDSCCSFCFNSFVKDVVQNLLHATSER